MERFNTDMDVGYKFKTNSGWGGKVVECVNAHNVIVLWQDGSTSSHSASSIRNGGIKPLYQPSVQGVGYFGEGRFSASTKKTGEKAPKVIHRYWSRMLRRCYSECELSTVRGRSYENVIVDDSWFCFQNFAEWAINQPNWNKGFHLDKDLLGCGSVYNADNCTFLPPIINSFLYESEIRPHHDLPMGVHYLKPRTSGSKEGYVARCCNGVTREYLGYFDNPNDAHATYVEAKERYAKQLAVTFKDDITEAAYCALLAFRVKGET